MSVHHAPSRRVVVTGMGIVSPLGVGIEPVWSRLVEGRSGIRRLPHDLVPDVAAKVGGVVPTREEDPEAGFDIDGVVSVKDQRKLGRFIAFALAASDEALAQAGFTPSTEKERERTATVIATGIGGFPEIAGAVRTTDERGTKRLSPFVIPSFLANLAAGWVSIRHGLKGPLGSPVTACAAGVQAIGDAARMIRAGEVDVAVCGGAEACIDRVSLGGFAAALALSTTHNEYPALASGPYDAAPDGFGILVIEALDHALARGAAPIAELVGYGTSADAYHLTAGPEDGSGAGRAMTMALRQARLDPTEIDHINAHATSTPVGDQGELAAIRALFGEARPIITSTKSATGHLLGAAGGIEAVFSVLALRDGIAPPTLNLLNPDPFASGMDIVAGTARRRPLRTALSNGFGFGGVNASLVFQRMG